MKRSECTAAELQDIGYVAQKKISTLSGSWVEECTGDQITMVFDMVVKTVQNKGKMRLIRSGELIEVHSDEWKQQYSVLNVEYFICRRLEDG